MFCGPSSQVHLRVRLKAYELFDTLICSRSKIQTLYEPFNFTHELGRKLIVVHVAKLWRDSSVCVLISPKYNIFLPSTARFIGSNLSDLERLTVAYIACSPRNQYVRHLGAIRELGETVPLCKSWPTGVPNFHEESNAPSRNKSFLIKILGEVAACP